MEDARPGVNGALDRLLDPARVRFITASLLVCGMVLLVLSFVTSEQGRTWAGPPLGADFTGFYTAGVALRNGLAEQLYDNAAQDQLYHDLFPNLAAEKKLPYVHPPFVALGFRLLAELPYAWAYGAWLVCTLGLYLAGLAFMLRCCPLLAADRDLVLLAALSFEPFMMECALGGQLSAVGFFCLALAWWCENADRPFASGMALGLCLYKPTLLVVLLPMLIVARRTRLLMGFAAAAVALAMVSYIGVGETACLAFLQRMIGFAQTTSHDGTLQPPLYKFVDLNSFLRMLLGEDPFRNRLLLAALGIAPFIGLILMAWKYSRGDEKYRALVWAAGTAGGLVLNLYVGIYDTIVLVLCLALTAQALRFDQRRTAPFVFKVLLLALYLVPWSSQHLARRTGFQLYTLVLMGLVLYLLRHARRLAVARTAPA